MNTSTTCAECGGELYKTHMDLNYNSDIIIPDVFVDKCASCGIVSLDSTASLYYEEYLIEHYNIKFNNKIYENRN
jgi:YgiT-type zinc finger domain-containing protein